MLTNKLKVQECDATGDDKNTSAGLKKIHSHLISIISAIFLITGQCITINGT
jgi:hypothetical protein